VPAGTAASVTVTVTNRSDISVSRTFKVSANPCPLPTVVAGLYHTVALRGEGTLWAWGANAYGQLGNGTSSPLSVPVKALFP
jgi:alpha-tubulin suppressor-like RCC1 family protein